jgi:chaperonin cofactor prefoldin
MSMNRIKPSNIDVYHVFLASPGDMSQERQEVRLFFEEYNRATANPREVRFDVVDWENYASAGVGRTQALISEQTLKRFEKSLALVVALMGARFGSPTGEFQSGTEEEFEYALKLWRERGFPEIKWFLRDVQMLQVSPDPDRRAKELEQWDRVSAFRRRLKEGDPPVFYKTFQDLESFRQVLGSDLRLWLGHPDRPWFVGRSLPDALVETVVADVLTNVEHLDSRLSYVMNALQTDASEERVKQIRASIAPKLAAANASSFDRFTAEARVASLRAALNSAPLYTNYSQSLVKGLVDKGAEAEVVTAFYARLGEAADAAESLLRQMSDSAARLGQTGPSSEEARAVDRQIVDVSARSLWVRSTLAYLAGLRLLSRFRTHLLPVASVRLAMLHNLEPKALMSEEEAIPVMQTLVDQWTALLQEKSRLLETQQQLYEKSLQEFEALTHKTDIMPTDPWYVVVGKARTLRQFGRIAEAVAAYARYADLFSASDPTAKQFSHIACQFTMQIEELGVTGGLYAYEINSGSVAEQAGIRVGDILVSYAAHATPEQENLMDALKAVPKGEPVRAEFLRLGESGQFEQFAVKLPAGSVGAGLMPI